MRVTATLTGLDAAIRAIKTIDPKAKAGAKKGVTAANKVALVKVKASLTRLRTGLLLKSLGSKVKVSGAVVYGIVGPRLGFRTTIAAVEQSARRVVFVGFRGRKGAAKTSKVKIGYSRKVSIGDVIDPSKYAHLIELGHQSAHGGGMVQAYPFIKPARDAVASDVRQIIVAEINTTIHGGT